MCFSTAHNILHSSPGPSPKERRGLELRLTTHMLNKTENLDVQSSLPLQTERPVEAEQALKFAIKVRS